jgi:PHD/YefM family antitoxin component YafN of YafNO toxin-antitoxin module
MKPQFITDEAGNRTAVILSVQEYEQLLDELDEAHSVRLYDDAKAENLTFRPLEEALTDIDRKRATRDVSGSVE